ncbi:MAG TPA: hypothetical protein VFU02_09835 [Polyangiaceae bacterium]|nr:hypothetical protein [Polyangiaceae bacterium]
MRPATEVADSKRDLAERAHAGELEAQYDLARLLRKSKVPEDRASALRWLRLAADQGHVGAAFLLGWCFETETSAEGSAKQMVHYYTMAAERGHALACSNLGLCYERGDAGAIDLELAFGWYRRGSELGGKEATFQLGRCYDEGLFVPVDERRAPSLFSMAAKRGYASAHFRLGTSYEERAGREQDEFRKRRLQRVAVAHYERGAERGDPDAQYNLAICYFNGEGVATDAARAVAWLARAVESGDADAQYRLAKALSNGEGVPQNHARALELFQKAAAQGNARALTALAWAYREGEGTAPNPELAIRYFREAAELGYARAECALGASLATGNGIARDDAEALVWLRKAAEHGDDQAAAYLGLFYLDGRGGLAKDEVEGFRRIAAGAGQALPWAEARLGWCYWDGIGVEPDPIAARTWLAAATANGLAEAAVGFARQPGMSRDDIDLARTWLAAAARRGDEDARFWQHRLWFVTHWSWRWLKRGLLVAGYAGLLYQLLTAPLRFEWLGTIVFVGVIVLVAVVSVIALTLATNEQQVDALTLPPDSTDFRPSWRVLLGVPAEDGFFLVPLLYIGVTPLTALISGSLFALAHLPNYRFWSTVPKGISYFLVGLFLLPWVGIWPIVLGHVLLDAFLIALRRGQDQ